MESPKANRAAGPVGRSLVRVASVEIHTPSMPGFICDGFGFGFCPSPPTVLIRIGDKSQPSDTQRRTNENPKQKMPVVGAFPITFLVRILSLSKVRNKEEVEAVNKYTNSLPSSL
jgi:hypothetical protein